MTCQYLVSVDGQEVNRFKDQESADKKASELNEKLFEYGKEAYVEAINE